MMIMGSVSPFNLVKLTSRAVSLLVHAVSLGFMTDDDCGNNNDNDDALDHKNDEFHIFIAILMKIKS